MGSVTNLKENKTLYMPCDCHNEILVMEYDHGSQVADFSIYEHGISCHQKMSLWQRLVCCYRILWYKKQYSDQISLSKKQLVDLKNFLISLELK